VNYYELLRIPRDSDAAAIKRAYFSEVKLHSPDSDPEGFKAIRLAYDTLSDPKKRAGYDAYFVTSGEAQDELLEARSLIRENQYKQAAEFLAGLLEKNPDSADVKRLLAEVLWRLKKSGGADKLCVELLAKDPADLETLLLRGNIAVSRGHTNKAAGYFDEAVAAAPRKARAWVECIRFAMKHEPWRVKDVFYRAMEQDEEMFRDNYVFYLVGARGPAYETIADHLEEKDLRYYDKFAEYFINDKSVEEETFASLMGLMPSVLGVNELIPFAKKVLPALENSRHRTDGDSDDFKYARDVITTKELRGDKRIHDIIADMTELFLFEGKDKDKDELLSMECYVAFNLPEIRPSLKVLKNNYPELFKLNQAFYLDALNEKKADFLIDKYVPVQKKLMKKIAGNNLGDDDSDDEEPFEPEEAGTFVRAAPKVGRNVPCPCGSGKKYKKCCG